MVREIHFLRLLHRNCREKWDKSIEVRKIYFIFHLFISFYENG